MNISEENPPYRLRPKMESAFDLSRAKPVWTVGNTIYNPHKGPIDPFLEVHEAVHAHQQGTNPEKWWDDYLAHGAFRFRQEVEAYQVQYQVAKDTVRDRELLSRMLFAWAQDLSGYMYGRLCTHAEAVKLIKRGVV